MKPTAEIIVTIRQVHLDNGIRANCHACPVYLAFKDLLTATCDLTVKREFIILELPTSRAKIHLPFEVRQFISKFDTFNSKNDLKLKPFEFKMDVPLTFLNIMTRSIYE